MALLLSLACTEQPAPLPEEDESPAGAELPAPVELPPAVPDQPAGIAGAYRLEEVGERDLPATTETRPGCELQIVSGRLELRAAGRFTFRSATREVCAGETARRESHSATGTYTVQDGTLELDATAGQAFGAASGIYDRSTVTLTGLETEGGTRSVDWLFQKQ